MIIVKTLIMSNKSAFVTFVTLYSYSLLQGDIETCLWICCVRGKREHCELDYGCGYDTTRVSTMHRIDIGMYDRVQSVANVMKQRTSVDERAAYVHNCNSGAEN